MKMTTWEVKKPYLQQDYAAVDRYTAVIDDRAIGRFDTSDEAYEAIIRELVRRLDCREARAEWHTFRGDLSSQGYRPYIEYIDQEIAMQPCPVCGGQSEYYGFKKYASYRAFSVCRACGHFLEF
jgi:hypothetical protein